jgi:ABC-type transport system involved in multi-copper enzyme maturation permease subunit
MLLFLAVFLIFVILLTFILSKITDLTLVFASRLRSNTLSWTATGVSFIFSYILSVLIVFYLLHFIANFTKQIQVADNLLSSFPVDKKDCPAIIDTIYQSENSIYNYENHRYIEESSPLFTIKVEYEKGAKKLANEIKAYDKLKLADKSQQTIEKIKRSIREKADLFNKRSKLNINHKAFDTISGLIADMDGVTQSRLEIINEIKNQCSIDN